MAKKFMLAATNRETSKHSAREARDNKGIPGIVYGYDIKPTSITVNYSEFLKLYRKAGSASVIDLNIEGKEVQVLVQQLDQDPVRDHIIHIDLLAINPKEATIVHVPFVFEGESPAVKSLGGVFIKNMDTLEIRCLPADIPHDVVVNISALAELHDQISVKDLELDLSNLELVHVGENDTICTVVGRAKKEEETTEAAPVEAAPAEDAE